MPQYIVSVSVDSAYEWIGDFRIILPIPESQDAESYIENFLKDILDDGLYQHMDFEYDAWSETQS